MIKSLSIPHLRSTLDLVTSVVVLVAASTLIYHGWFSQSATTRAQIAVPSKPVSIESAPIRGADDAEAIMIVYSDFQCPYCARFTREVLPAIERQYIETGRIAFAFRHLPLPIHPFALRAAVSAECASQQGRFWEMHDLLFAQERLDESILRVLPESAALDRRLFDQCVVDDAVEKRVQSSANEAAKLGIRGTPAFFFGRRVKNGFVNVSGTLSGTHSIDDFIKHLDATLRGQRKSWPSWIPWSSRPS